MLKGLLVNYYFIPTCLWITDWTRRVVVIELMLFNFFNKFNFFIKRNFNTLVFSWSNFLFKNPTTFYSLPLSFLLLSFFCDSSKNNKLVFRKSLVLFFSVETSLLHGQTKRWGPVGFFIRWWSFSVSSLLTTSCDSNKTPHDFWLLGSSTFFFLI